MDNPVVVFLHGGPSSPESYVNYCWVDDLLDDYTVIDWDQRGCGRTYVRNKDIDPNNTSASFDQALADLDELVDYARDRFGQDKVILVGHSYGTVLGTCYIERHSEKVSHYVGIAQVVSMDVSNQIMVREAFANSSTHIDDVAALSEAYEMYLANPCVSTTLQLRQKAALFLPSALPDHSTWFALTSPYMGMEDFAWFLKQMGPLDEYLSLNQQLFDSLQEFDLRTLDISSDIPLTFVSGSRDYVCPVEAIEEYGESSDAAWSLSVIDECGHNVQYSEPHEVSQEIAKALEGEACDFRAA